MLLNKFRSIHAKATISLVLLVCALVSIVFGISYFWIDIDLTKLLWMLLITLMGILLITYPIYYLLRLILDSNHERLKKRHLSEVSDYAADMIFILKADGTIADANKKATDILGYTRRELIEMSTWDLDVDYFMRSNTDLLWQVRQGEAFSFQSEYRCKDGSTVPVESHVSLAGWLNDTYYLEIARDITQRRESEEELRHSKEILERMRNRLESRVQERTVELAHETKIREQAEQSVHEIRHLLENLVNSMPSVIIALDARFRVTEWNQEAEKVLSISAQDATGRLINEVLPDFQSTILNFTHSNEQGSKSITRRISLDLNQERRQFEVMLYPLTPTARLERPGLVIRIDDVTDKVRIDEMLVQTEKMLSLGGLAAGMAHEINNPLGAILQSTQNIQRRLSLNFARNEKIAEESGVEMSQLNKYLTLQRIPEFLNSIRDAGERAAHIVGDMLSFARPSLGENAAIVVTDSLDSSCRLAGKDYNQKKKFDFKNIEIEREYEKDLPLVIAQKNQLEQVFLNLLVNAAQAMASDKRNKYPKIWMRAKLQEDVIRIDIEDNGPGMDESTRRRVFEPFFTTKEEGAGTGLGLSVSYFIVTEQLGGNMMLESAQGRGTCFSIYLPHDGKIKVQPMDASATDKPKGQIELPFLGQNMDEH